MESSFECRNRETDAGCHNNISGRWGCVRSGIVPSGMILDHRDTGLSACRQGVQPRRRTRCTCTGGRSPYHCGTQGARHAYHRSATRIRRGSGQGACTARSGLRFNPDLGSATVGECTRHPGPARRARLRTPLETDALSPELRRLCRACAACHMTSSWLPVPTRGTDCTAGGAG